LTAGIAAAKSRRVMCGRTYAVCALLFSVSACHHSVSVKGAGRDAQAGDDREPMDAFSGLDALGGVDAIVLTDAEGRDARPTSLDGGVLPDLGPAQPGEACETALPWDVQARDFIIGTTTRAEHRDRLTCVGPGAGAIAPENWRWIDVVGPKHLILRLGTAGWDGVIAARTATCSQDNEACGNAPAILELPLVRTSSVLIGIQGFSDGRGPYIVRAQLGPALFIPSNASCATPDDLSLPESREAHDFGGNDLMLSGCEIASAMYYRLHVATAGMYSFRVAPLARQDVELGLLADCGGPAISCARTARRGSAQTIGPINLAAGLYVLAVGTRAAAPTPGSFMLSVRANAQCRSDLDCAIDRICDDRLSCSPPAGLMATSTASRAIPDGQGALDLPLRLPGPGRRPTHVRVRLELSHPSPQDLVVTLTSPPSPDPITVRLRDRSPGELALVYGADREPDGPGSFDDFGLVSSSTGTWTLHVEDRVLGDPGFVLRYSLEVE
jgi:hypothetical protein